MENIVDEFKKYAKELGTLYRTRKELDSLIIKYENKLKGLGEVLEFAEHKKRMTMPVILFLFSTRVI